MINKRIIDGNEFIHPSDIYEWLLEQLQKGTLCEDMEAFILHSLKELEWVKSTFQPLSTPEVNRMYKSVLNGMRNGSCPPDLMSWSAMFFNFTQRGINSDSMGHEINNNPIINNLLNEFLAVGHDK